MSDYFLEQWREKYTETELTFIIELGVYAYEQVKEQIQKTSVSQCDIQKRIEMVLRMNIKTELEKEYKQKMEEIGSMCERISLDKEHYKVAYETGREAKEEEIQRIVNHQKEMFAMTQQQNASEKQAMLDKLVFLEKEMERMREQMRAQQTEMERKVGEKANEKVRAELATMGRILSEKDKQNEHYGRIFEKFEGAFEKLNKYTEKRDVVSIGKQGETQFMELARNTFRDFDGFVLEDVHKQGGSGDFHLQFKDFNVLVDSKLYSNKVNSTSREKIKRDLFKNEHIHFAWLVSLDTMIDKFDKAPFMFEWLSSQQCVCYVNSLFKNENPGEVLRALYYSCNSLKSIMQNEEKELSELSELKKKQLQIKEIAQKMVKNNRERETIINQLRQNMDKNDEFVRDMLNAETQSYVDDYVVKISQWISIGGGVAPDSKISSTTLWGKFKKENAELARKMDIETFKRIVRDDVVGITIKNTGKSTFDIYLAATP